MSEAVTALSAEDLNAEVALSSARIHKLIVEEQARLRALGANSRAEFRLDTISGATREEARRALMPGFWKRLCRAAASP